MNTFDLTRILSVWNVLKTIIIVFILVQFTSLIAGILGIEKLPAMAFVFGSVSVFLIAYLRLNPPPTIKEVEAVNVELAEFKHILAVSTIEEAKNKLKGVEAALTNAEQMQKQFEQNEIIIKQLDATIKQTKSSEEQNLASAKRTIFERDELRTNLLQVQNKAAKAFEENEQLYAKNKQLANELEEYKNAIDDLTNINSPYHNLFKESNPEAAWKSFMYAMNPKANYIDKLLPKSVRALVKQYESVEEA